MLNNARKCDGIDLCSSLRRRSSHYISKRIFFFCKIKAMKTNLKEVGNKHQFSIKRKKNLNVIPMPLALVRRQTGTRTKHVQSHQPAFLVSSFCSVLFSTVLLCLSQIQPVADADAPSPVAPYSSPTTSLSRLSRVPLHWLTPPPPLS